MGRGFDWFDSRFGIREPHRRFLKRRIPAGITYAYCFGGMAFTFFVILAISGFFLSLHYVPSEREAYRSIVFINETVMLGWLIRGIHKWSATCFIVCILLHTIRVIASRAYRPPRELNWMAGVLTIVLALASGFTGYLLPWDQRAYWATEVGTSMFETVPLVGQYLLFAVRGGPDITGLTLVRFYSMHVLFLPGSMAVILYAHFHMVKRQGIARDL